MLLNPQQKDRALGAFLGLAVGDALGTTLEFRPRDTYPPLTDMVGGGPFGLDPGVWTDDTSMAVALAESLIAKPDFDPHDLMARFVNWWRWGVYSPTGECFDIGITTRTALAHFESSGDAFAGSTDPRSAGNGSLMRLAPIALWGLGRHSEIMRRAARDQSRTTHAAAACLDACESFALTLTEAIRSGDFERALAAGELAADEPVIADVFAGSWREKARHEVASSSYVVHSLEAAFWCVAETECFADAVLLAANLGDDADTTAAITGQLAGALHGQGGIPSHWLERLAWRDEIESLAEQLIAV